MMEAIPRLMLAAVACIGLLSAGGIGSNLCVELAAWNATDILVLAPTSDRASFRVVEVIKGDQQLGDVLVLDALAPPAVPPPPSSHDDIHEIYPPPTMQPADRLLVFLARPGGRLEYDPRTNTSEETKGWQPANSLGEDLRTSAVWFLQGGVFGFMQRGSPGPTEFIDLAELMLTEQKVRDQVKATLQLRSDMDLALTQPAGSIARAAQLAHLVRSDNLFAPESALEHLSEGGPAAEDALRELLFDQSLIEKHPAIASTLVKMTAKNPGFGLILREETQYWTTACTSLEAGWWSNAGHINNNVIKSHYSRANTMLQGIRELHLTEDIPEVRNFHAIWIKCPPIERPGSGNPNQLSDECELLLKPIPNL